MSSQFSIRGLIGVAIGLSFSAVMYGQAPGGRPPGGGGGGVNPTPGRSPSPTGRMPDSNTTSLPDIQRPIFLSGKVIMDDGTAPPDSVTMRLVCNSSPRSVGFTDSKGRFSIDLSNRNNAASFMDASEQSSSSVGGPGGFGASRPGAAGTSGRTSSLGSLNSCELQAYLAGFRSDSINLYNRRALENPDVGTIILHRLGNVEGLTISVTSALAPKDAKKAFEKGRNEAKKGKWEQAEREYQKAVDEYPKYAAAWYELGLAQEERKNFDGARKCYAQAMAADSKFVSPYQQLAMIAAREQKWQEVADDTERVVHLNPVDFPQAWFFNSLANYNLKKFDAAEKSARQGLATDPSHHVPKINHLLGVLLAQKRDYAGAAENMRVYLKYAPEASDAEIVKKQLAEVERLAEPQAKSAGATQ